MRYSIVVPALALTSLLLAGCTAPSTQPNTPALTMTTKLRAPETQRSEFGSADASSADRPAIEGTPHDSGSRESATGTTNTDRNGVPVEYIVEEGDTAWGVEQRFGIDGVAERYNRYLQVGEHLDLTNDVTSANDD